jgi:hypothetical protein
MKITPEICAQLRSAYHTAAPVSSRAAESRDADEFAAWWWEQELACQYHLGCPSFSDRPALLYAVLGCKHLCGVDHKSALRMLRMAIAEIEAAHPNPLDFGDRIDAASGGAQ